MLKLEKSHHNTNHWFIMQENRQQNRKWASDIYRFHLINSFNGQISYFQNRTAVFPSTLCPKQTSPLNRLPLLVRACPSPSCRYPPSTPSAPPWPLSYLLPSDPWPLAAGQCPVGSARATHPNRYYKPPHRHMRVRVCVCAREDRTHPVRHWLVRAGPTQHPGNYPGPAAADTPSQPPRPTHATMPARW